MWKKIKDYNYEVSNTGEVRNIKTQRVLKQHSNQNGQVTVMVYKDGSPKRMLVSRLVATNFLKTNAKYNVVMHLNDTPSDNRVENLKWGTQAMNLEDMFSKERDKRLLSKEQREFVKAVHVRVKNQFEQIPSGKHTTKQLMEMFGVGKSVILKTIQL